jgi:hypothetical protein
MRNRLGRWLISHEKWITIFVIVSGTIVMPLLGYFLVARVGIADTLNSSPFAGAAVMLAAWVLACVLIARQDADD